MSVRARGRSAHTDVRSAVGPVVSAGCQPFLFKRVNPGRPHMSRAPLSNSLCPQVFQIPPASHHARQAGVAGSSPVPPTRKVPETGLFSQASAASHAIPTRLTASSMGQRRPHERDLAVCVGGVIGHVRAGIVERNFDAECASERRVEAESRIRTARSRLPGPGRCARRNGAPQVHAPTRPSGESPPCSRHWRPFGSNWFASCPHAIRRSSGSKRWAIGATICSNAFA